MAALALSSAMDGMPTLRQNCVTTDAAKPPLELANSHSASHFRVIFVTHSLWHNNCLSSFGYGVD
jgi:hypothetical protein